MPKTERTVLMLQGRSALDDPQRPGTGFLRCGASADHSRRAGNFTFLDSEKMSLGHRHITANDALPPETVSENNDIARILG